MKQNFQKWKISKVLKFYSLEKNIILSFTIFTRNYTNNTNRTVRYIGRSYASKLSLVLI